MAKDKPSAKLQYGDVVARLQQIVDSLEGGTLSLEDSLERFAEGVQLVKQGEALLTDAEKRIEQLLTEDGKSAPLDASKEPPPPPPSKPAKGKAPPADDDDVPF